MTRLGPLVLAVGLCVSGVDAQADAITQADAIVQAGAYHTRDCPVCHVLDIAGLGDGHTGTEWPGLDGQYELLWEPGEVPLEMTPAEVRRQ